MTVIASYGAVALPGLNATKTLTPDDNGYYPCVLGGFDMASHAGVYYAFTNEVKKLFEPGGLVYRRLERQLMKGEIQHPSLEGMNLDQILKRLSIIDETKVSHHIKRIDLREAKDENGRPIILAVGMVRPSGPYASTLQGYFDNHEENLAFSIRSFTKTAIINGRPVKIVTDALTYDHVTEPGIHHATKFKTVALESIDSVIGVNLESLVDIKFTEADLDRAIASSITDGLESDTSRLTMVKTSLGWGKIQVINPGVLSWR